MLYCARLHICVGRFNTASATADTARILGLLEVYNVAVGLIEAFSALDAATDFALYSTFYYSRSLALACLVILKLHRCSLEIPTDREKGEICYFGAVHLLRRRAVFSPDLDSKLSAMFIDLWSSTAVFRNAEGHVDSLRVRIRSRLVSASECRNLIESQLTSLRSL